MAGSLNITSAIADPELLDLPWNVPLEQWPDDTIAALPKGISRHLVRFAHLSGYVIAIKETSAEFARREYEMLRTLQRIDVPCVEPVAVITDRTDAEGNELDSVLVTRHLKFSLPYRALYSQSLRPETATRLVDALAVLLVRLHIVGFFWGDVSLSNTLFRRDAGAFAAYLVDAETGQMYDGLSNGQRENDLEIARVNIAGELLDLQSGGRLEEDLDPVEISNGIVEAYRNLWKELTGPEEFDQSERWRINRRVERLNSLGFDIEELAIKTDESGTQVRIQPKVVDAGHHSRRLLRLTGLDAGENQARRLLNDLDSYRATFGKQDVDEEMVAHEWLAQVFEPVIRAIPKDLRGKLEPAEIFHQLLDHRWYMSQNEGRDVPLAEALNSYVDEVLRHRRDEATVISPVTESITLPIDVIDEDDWRLKVTTENRVSDFPRRGPLASVGRSAARHPVFFLGGWVIVLGVIFATAILGLGGQGLFGRLASGIPTVQQEAYHGQQLLTTGAKSTTYTLLVHGVDPESPSLARIASDLSTKVSALPRARYVDPLAAPRRTDGSRQPALAPLFSTDGRGVLLPVSTLGVGRSAPTAAAERQVRTLLDSTATVVRRDFPHATVTVGGGALLLNSLVGQSSKDLEKGEAVALPIALVVMLVVFGGFIAAGLPLLGALASILGAFGAVFATTFATDIDATVINVITAIGLGLSIDYGLLLVSRFREEYRRAGGGDGLDRRDRRLLRIEAIAAATATAGRTAAFSGTTFAIASLGLLVFEPAVVREIGIASVFVTVVSMLSELNLMPALLSVTGERLTRPGVLTRVPGVRRFMGRFGDVAPDDGFFSRLTRRVQRHPAIMTISCAVVLLAIGSPLLSLQLANTSVDAIPRVSSQYQFSTTIANDFPDAAAPRVELVTRTRADALSWAQTVEALPGVKSVGTPSHSGSAWGSLVRVTGSDGVSVVRAIRAHPPRFDHWVTGLDASTADLADSLVRGSPLALLIIVLGTVVLLFLMTGSLVVPLKALVASALSLGAAMGALVWGFQDGNFASILNFDPSHVYGVDVIVLLLTIVFGFGLAMDYEMFLLSRIKERLDAGTDSHEAVALGLQRSGRIITSAALIIIVVFAGFASGDLMIIKQLGIALAVAVFFDATLVRCLLVPAFMTWQQSIMWWAPRWAKRLHARIGLAD